MKTKLLIIAFCLTFYGCATQKITNNAQEKVVIAYVASGTKTIPNPHIITHINYAFGHVNKTFNGINISNKTRFSQIVALKNENPKLKILLSIGGWGSGGFSEMAANKKNRKLFAKKCKQILREFNIDGIDIDWEYPTITSAGISASPSDVDNFTLMMHDIRKAIGRKKLLTLATAASGRCINFKDIDPYINFINIMDYDIAYPPHHQSALYRSELAGEMTCEESIAAHIAAGAPKEKLVLGMPFYGHGIDSIPRSIPYKKIIELKDYEERWDDTAKVPYLTDKNGKFVLCYDNARSLSEKCKYALQQGLLGVMYWEYTHDDSNETLAKTVFNTIFNK